MLTKEILDKPICEVEPTSDCYLSYREILEAWYTIVFGERYPMPDFGAYSDDGINKWWNMLHNAIRIISERMISSYGKEI